MPTVTDEKAKEEGITHYIDYVAYSQNSNSETMSASDILNDVRQWIINNHGEYVSVWDELIANDGKASKCKSRQSARTLLKYIQTGYKL